VPTLTAVLDATVIIGLAKGEIFDHLSRLYRPVYVPRAVREEVVQHGQGRVGAGELSRALGVWITEVLPDHTSLQQFSALRSVADREVLAIAHDPARAVDHLLSDDDQLLRRATQPGLICLRTPDLAVFMKRQGLVSEVRFMLDRMRQQGFGIEDALYEKALRAAGE
jgi:predicted nucleic acid-binding protein